MKEAFIGYVNNKKYHYPLEGLTKHMFAFGSSGSGKTVFSKVVIEEAAINGIPSILVDPQGDLASLIKVGDEENKDIEENRNKYSKDVVVRIFTPASAKGIPICINPLNFNFDDISAEDIIPLLNEISTSIARLTGFNTNNDKGKSASAIFYHVIKHYVEKKENIQTFKRLVQIFEKILLEYETENASDLAKKVEEFINNKSDLETLIRKIKYLTFGQKELLFEFGVPLDIPTLLGKNNDDPRTQISVIYLNTLVNQDEKEFFIMNLSTNLYQWMLSNPSNKLQCLFYIDEVAPFLPAGSEKPMPKPILMLLFKQARKYGVGLIIATQNPGDIDYKAFAQFGTWAIGRLTVKQDQKKIQETLKSMSDIDISNELPKLKPGNFLLFAPDITSKIEKIKVRRLLTEHITLNEVSIKKLITKEDRDFYSQYIAEKEKSSAKSATNKMQDFDDVQDIDDESYTDSDSLNVKMNSKTKKKTSVRQKQDSVNDNDTEFEEELVRNATLDESSKIKHFPLMVNDVSITKLIEKHKKKNLLMQSTEKLGKYKLILRPILKCNIVQRRKIFFKTSLKNYLVLIDLVTGDLFTTGKTGRYFTYYSEFNKLYKLTPSQLQILSFLYSQNKSLSAMDIGLKMKLATASVTKALKVLKTKRLVSFKREGKHEFWHHVLLSNQVSNSIQKMHNTRLDVNLEKINANFAKPKVSNADIDKLIDGWFQDCHVNSSEIIYLPIYEISYAGKKGIRKVKINAYTTNIINN